LDEAVGLGEKALESAREFEDSFVISWAAWKICLAYITEGVLP
jgi:hypothetical protein